MTYERNDIFGWYCHMPMPTLHGTALQPKLQTQRDGREAGARLVSFDLVLWNVVVDCGLWWREPDTSRQLRHPTLFVRRDVAQPASQPQPVTGRISANKLAFMWWRRQCKKFIVRETSCVPAELLTFDNYSLKIRQNSACLK